MTIPEDLAIVPDFLIAVLAAWLGVTLLARGWGEYVTRVFAWLTLVTTIYSTARVIGALTVNPSIAAVALETENATSTVLPAALLHMVLAFTAGRRKTGFQRAALIAAYAVGALAASVVVGGRNTDLSVLATGREFWGVPEPVIAWVWLVFRAAVMGMAIWWAYVAWRAAEGDQARRGQLSAVLVGVVIAVLGGITTILGTQLVAVQWPGTSLIAVSLGLAAYAVFKHRAFLAPSVARRSFYYSLGTGLITAVYVTLIVGLEPRIRQSLAIEASLLTAVAILVGLALFDPLRDSLRGLLDGRSTRQEVTNRRLLNALGDELLLSERPETAIEPALAQLGHTLRLRGAAVLGRDGHQLAAYGVPPLDASEAALALPLRVRDRELGQVLFGPKRSRLPYTPADLDLCSDAVTFMAASLGLAERQEIQASALQALSEERSAVATQRASFEVALYRAAEPGPASTALTVHALGPLRVERDGQLIQRWGGAKAGTRQAEAMFAFLLDRGDRGVAKDEILEVIWPDVPLDKADIAFHRTLGGLRRSLAPVSGRGDESSVIVYHNDRYRLSPSVVAWSDVAAFEARLANARRAHGVTAQIAELEGARELYRGDYMDDCPFYGDSLYVEERRVLLRGRYIDLLLALGERYESQGDEPSAAACFREALLTAGDDCPRADDGLARLGLPA